ncbi:MmpS family transport accessory protein [Mycobacteroides salmoniphilum]|uniref:MmpS family transport accessory protein n=1 Tax=Mycobacteroides salmoniphilum TaxID=404941 RepID=UPI0010654F9E|nr:MmpS family transport accessory protein [Mycobacteroides salmoniphilum]TDZ81800.1 Membrane protein [Mycobacteroides salmoniphilum]TDZ89300.1 Membrane protein [Mycobacteroides salmoniphilum]
MSGTDNPGSGTPGEVPDLDGPNLDKGDAAAADSSGADSSAFHSQAYSAPESEQFTSPYVPYDEYDTALVDGDEPPPPRWPWVVGVAAIIAAITLVASVALLVAGRSDETTGAGKSTSVTPTPSTTPWNEIITTTTEPPPPPPPPPTTEPPPPPPPPVTETVTVEPPPPPPPPVTTHEAPAPVTTTTTPPPPPPPPPPTTTTPAQPRQITYAVTGSKAPLDRITITYVDPQGRTRVAPNAYIPWSITVTPISNSEIGSVSASSMLRLSQLNCTITTSDGQVLSSNNNNSAQATC